MVRRWAWLCLVGVLLVSLSLVLAQWWQASLPVNTSKDPGGTLSIEGIRLGMSRTEVERRLGGGGTGLNSIYPSLSPANGSFVNVSYSENPPGGVDQVSSSILEIGGRPAFDRHSTLKAVFERFGRPDGVVRNKAGPAPPICDDYIYFRHRLCVSVDAWSPQEESRYYWLSRDPNWIINAHGGILEPLPSP